MKYEIAGTEEFEEMVARLSEPMQRHIERTIDSARKSGIEEVRYAAGYSDGFASCIATLQKLARE